MQSCSVQIPTTPKGISSTHAVKEPRCCTKIKSISNFNANETLVALLRQEALKAYTIVPRIIEQYNPTLLSDQQSTYKTKETIMKKIYKDAPGNDIQLTREDVGIWCYQTIDFFHMDREVMNLTMNYLDRILTLRYQEIDSVSKSSSNNHQIPRHGSKISIRATVMACLHIAIELSPTQVACHWEKNPWYQTFACASQGTVTPEDIILEEKNILFALNFYVNPPTIMGFIYAIIPFEVWECSSMTTSEPIRGNPSECSSNFSTNQIYDTCNQAKGAKTEPLLREARYLTELAVMQEFYIGYKASSIAMAALLATLHKVERTKIVIPELEISKHHLQMVQESLAGLCYDSHDGAGDTSLDVTKRSASAINVIKFDLAEVRIVKKRFDVVLDSRFPVPSNHEFNQIDDYQKSPTTSASNNESSKRKRALDDIKEWSTSTPESPQGILDYDLPDGEIISSVLDSDTRFEVEQEFDNESMLDLDKDDSSQKRTKLDPFAFDVTI